MAPMARPRMAEALATASRERQSAVLLYLFPSGSDWRIVLMKRPDYDGVHSGQISLPGGRLEAGETHRQAALREFREETGVRVEDSRLLGQLSSLFIPPSNFLVNPFVAYGAAQPKYVPDPLEVQQIIELPVSRLLDDAAVKQGRVPLSGGGWTETPYFDVSGHVVWGATAMILSEFKILLLNNQ